MTASDCSLFCVGHEVTVLFLSSTTGGLGWSRIVLCSLLLSLGGAVIGLLLIRNALWVLVLGLVSGVCPCMATRNSLKICKSDHYNCDVVQRLAHRAVLEDAFNTEAAILVHADVLLRLLRWGNLLLACRLGTLCLLGCLTSQPDSLSNVIIGELVEDAIGSECNEIVLLSNLECPNIRHRLDNVWISTSILKLGFRVSKGSADRETAWQDTNGSHDELWIHLLRLYLLLIEHL